MAVGAGYNRVTLLEICKLRSQKSVKKRTYDCIVIGGGHNGLVTAAYLAKAGRSVCVLERRHVLGGCATTEQLWPGYRVSTAAYVISLLRTEVIQELKLRENGFEVLPRNPSAFTPLLDGRSLTLGPDLRRSQEEIAKFSRADADAYPNYESLLEKIAATIDPLLDQAAPNLLPLPASWRKSGLGRKIRDTGQLWDVYKALGELGESLPEAVELMVGAARPILERWFESEVLRATLATDAIIGSAGSISAPGSAYILLHHVMGEAGGTRGVWGYVRGGMGGLADALEKVCKQLRVDIYRDAPVSKILTQKGAAAGVQLADDSVIESPLIASSVDAHWTFERLLDDQAILPDTFRQAVSRIDYSSASAKINLALRELPNFTCAPSSGVAPQHRGTIHISPTLDYLERAYDDSKYGWPSTEPILEMTIPSSVDDSLAPEGCHVASIFVQYAPYQLAKGTWDDIKEDFADRCIETFARYAPNLPDAIEHRQILSPLDMERTFGLTGGNIMQGAMNLQQMYSMRPVAGWADHRTPVRGLYLCGAASHPGGGVMGACGRNAAAEILRDRRL
jgi:phytoene dehydrogenase-like protein